MSCSAPAGRGCSAARRRPGSSSGATSSSSSWRPRLPAGHHPEPRIRRAGMVSATSGSPIVWVTYLLVFLGTLWKRKEPHIYVANWFYLAFIVTIAMLHIVNNLALPVIALQSAQELFGLLRRAGRADPVVVRPQRGRLLPDRRLPRDDVLLRPQAGRAADLFLPAVDRPLLGADLHLHLGRPAPPALHRAAATGRRPWA